MSHITKLKTFSTRDEGGQRRTKAMTGQENTEITLWQFNTWKNWVRENIFQKWWKAWNLSFSIIWHLEKAQCQKYLDNRAGFSWSFSCLPQGVKSSCYLIGPGGLSKRKKVRACIISISAGGCVALWWLYCLYCLQRKHYTTMALNCWVFFLKWYRGFLSFCIWTEGFILAANWKYF